MQKTVSFKKKLIATTIASYALAGFSGAVFAQESNDTVEEVVVLGVKGAQKSAIEGKREAQSIVDGISAEDIGKLPDATITDSLQRITGVQIQRNAGEGDRISIRGMQQVALLLNGEQYLGAGNIAGAQPNLGDIPAQLLHGSQVYKSLDVRNAQSGITGTTNIQTWRPMDFKDGLTVAGGLEVGRGQKSKENDPTLNVLLNWHGDNLGAMFSAVTGSKNLANDSAGEAAASNDRRTLVATGETIPAAAHGFDMFLNTKERNRDGFNAAFQADLGEGFKVVTEAFYTHFKEYDRQTGLDISNRWLGETHPETWVVNGWAQSNIATPSSRKWSGTGKNGSKWFLSDEYNVEALWINTYSINNVTTSSSKNFNFELNYDNGGAFTGSIRAIKGDANELDLHANGQGDFANWVTPGLHENLKTFYPANVVARLLADPVTHYTLDSRHLTEVGVHGGRYITPNPEGYGQDPSLTLKRSDFQLQWGGFNTPIVGGLGAGKTLKDYFANLNSQRIGAYALEGNHENDAGLRALSLKGNYKFEDDMFISNVEVGLRKSTRDVNVQAFHMFSPFYVGSDNYATNYTPDPAHPGQFISNNSRNILGCEAQWKAIDQTFNGGDGHSQCTAGERLVGSETDPNSFTPYTVNPPTRIDAFGAKVKWISSLGDNVKGIPGFWAIDPKTFDDPIAFHKKAFGGANRVTDPAASYFISLDETDAYVFSGFKGGIFSGNFGVRVIQNELTAVINQVGGDQFANGNLHYKVGEDTRSRTYNYVLPSLNAALDVSDSFKIRFAAAKNKQELDLGNYGSSTSISSGPDANDPTVRIPSGYSSGGNFDLKPWLSKNVDLSAEYYMGDASMVSIGLFKIKIDSFVTTANHTHRDFLINGKTYNLEGSETIAGKDGETKGIELGAKVAFSDLTSGFLSNFGVDANYTYSPSKRGDASHDISGESYPFDNNSQDTANLVGWYQNGGLQVRLAFNYRSDRFSGANGDYGYAVWDLGGTFVDLNVSYDVVENVTVYLSGSNLTGTDQRFVYRLKDGIQSDNQIYDLEARYNVGVRAKF